MKENIYQLIYLIRGKRVMLSPDLARLYGVAPRALIQAVNRNRARFPEDFLLRLDLAEARSLEERLAGMGRGRYSKYPPFAFTEQGVAMLSSVLRSETAVQANISIMRAFVKTRELAAQNKELMRKLDELERRVDRHDADIGALIDAIRQDLSDEKPKPLKIGFKP